MILFQKFNSFHMWVIFKENLVSVIKSKYWKTLTQVVNSWQGPQKNFWASYSKSVPPTDPSCGSAEHFEELTKIQDATFLVICSCIG